MAPTAGNVAVLADLNEVNKALGQPDGLGFRTSSRRASSRLTSACRAR